MQRWGGGMGHKLTRERSCGASAKRLHLDSQVGERIAPRPGIAPYSTQRTSECHSTALNSPKCPVCSLDHCLSLSSAPFSIWPRKRELSSKGPMEVLGRRMRYGASRSAPHPYLMRSHRESGDGQLAQTWESCLKWRVCTLHASHNLGNYWEPVVRADSCHEYSSLLKQERRRRAVPCPAG